MAKLFTIIGADNALKKSEGIDQGKGNGEAGVKGGIEGEQLVVLRSVC